MQKDIQKQSKERSDKGKRDTCEFRLVSILMRSLQRRAKEPQANQTKIEPPLQSSRPLDFYLLI